MSLAPSFRPRRRPFAAVSPLQLPSRWVMDDPSKGGERGPRGSTVCATSHPTLELERAFRMTMTMTLTAYVSFPGRNTLLVFQAPEIGLYGLLPGFTDILRRRYKYVVPNYTQYLPR